jgi:cytochrome b561
MSRAERMNALFVPDPTSQLVRDRYTRVAILLHWSCAAALAAQIVLGWRLVAEQVLVRSSLLQLHKSIGILILILTLVRLFWRMWKPPPQPLSPKPIEQMLARWVHVGFYTLLLVLPLSGWAMTSLRSPAMLRLFGVLPWPHLPLTSLLSISSQEMLADKVQGIHVLASWLMIGLLLLHIAGALKHHFISKDGTIGLMLPGLAPGAIGWRFLAVPLAGMLLALTVYLIRPSVPAFRPKVEKLEQADLFLDFVGPGLLQRCGSCHNDGDVRGGLSTTNYESLMQGGRSGPSVIAGDPLGSELFRRISLSPDDAKFMPRGRQPLTTSQILAIKLWIETGALETKSVAELHLSRDQRSNLQQLLDENSSVEGPPITEPLPVVPQADSRAVKQLAESGFVVRKVSRATELLDVTFQGPGPITDTDWAALTTIADQTFNLNLHNAGVTDENLKLVSKFVNLAHLRLDSNSVGDEGVTYLTSLHGLVSLNLVNSKVSDASIVHITTLGRLRRLYLWGSSVSTEKISALKLLRPELEVLGGTTAGSTEPKESTETHR